MLLPKIGRLVGVRGFNAAQRPTEARNGSEKWSQK